MSGTTPVSGTSTTLQELRGIIDNSDGTPTWQDSNPRQSVLLSSHADFTNLREVSRVSRLVDGSGYRWELTTKEAFPYMYPPTQLALPTVTKTVAKDKQWPWKELSNGYTYAHFVLTTNGTANASLIWSRRLVTPSSTDLPLMDVVRMLTFLQWAGSDMSDFVRLSIVQRDPVSMTGAGRKLKGTVSIKPLDANSRIGKVKVSYWDDSGHVTSSQDVWRKDLSRLLGAYRYYYRFSGGGELLGSGAIISTAATPTSAGDDPAPVEPPTRSFLTKTKLRVAMAGVLLVGAWYMARKRGNAGMAGVLALIAVALLATTLISAFSTSSGIGERGQACTSTSQCGGTNVYCVANLDDPTKGTCQNVGPNSTPCAEEGVVCKGNPLAADDATNNAGTCYSLGCGRSVEIEYDVNVGGFFQRHHKVRVMWPNAINIAYGLCVSTSEQSKDLLSTHIVDWSEQVNTGMVPWGVTITANIVGAQTKMHSDGITMLVNFGGHGEDGPWSIVQDTGKGSLLIKSQEMGGLMAPPPGKKWGDVLQTYVYDPIAAATVSNKKIDWNCNVPDVTKASLTCLGAFESLGFTAGDARGQILNQQYVHESDNSGRRTRILGAIRSRRSRTCGATEKWCAYNFATDFKTMSMLRGCGKSGCGINTPSGAIDGVARFYSRSKECHTSHCPVEVQKD